MNRLAAQCVAALVALSALGCSTPQQWVIVSVRDTLTRTPTEKPHLTIAPDGGLLATPSDKQSIQANHFGTARLELATGGSEYVVTVDAAGYDLQFFNLPALDGFFPSGKWLKGKPVRHYTLRPDDTLELMVTIEPQ